MFTVSLGAKTSHTVIHKKFSAYHLDVNHKQALRPYVSTEQHIHQTSREKPIVSIEVLLCQVKAIITRPQMVVLMTLGEIITEDCLRSKSMNAIVQSILIFFDSTYIDYGKHRWAENLDLV